ncbi:MAG: YtxH domain-containing protein [Pedobacter sp.]|nr:MAG: YtxH domain-containing protein [Pedobacter sp.]
MNYEKLMASVLARNTSNNSKVSIALIAGLAVGAALGVLFAPKSGASVRKSIGDQANLLGDGACNLYTSLRDRISGEHEPEVSTSEDEHIAHAVGKKPKSDIKGLIHEAHVNGIHTEQSLN